MRREDRRRQPKPGDAETRRHGDVQARGHGDAGTRRRGEKETPYGRGGAARRRYGDIQTRGYRDAAIHGRGDTETRRRGDAETRRAEKKAREFHRIQPEGAVAEARAEGARGEEVIYGIHPVLEVLRSERQVFNRLFIAEGRHGGPLQQIHQLAREKNIPLQLRRRDVLNRIAGTEHHQGVVGLASPVPYASLEEILAASRSAEGFSLVLILDSLEDPQNFGSLIRTAEACAARGIIIPKDRAVGLTPAAIKASAGAAAHIPVVRVTNLVHTLEELKKEGFWIVGADAGAEKSPYDMKFDMKVALVIGSEGKGIRPLILTKCDFTVAIPMKGKISSLNSAIAGAVILFEILRQRLGGQS